MESGDIPIHGQFKNTLFVFLQGLVHVYSVCAKGVCPLHLQDIFMYHTSCSHLKLRNYWPSTEDYHGELRRLKTSSAEFKCDNVEWLHNLLHTQSWKRNLKCYQGVEQGQLKLMIKQSLFYWSLYFCCSTLLSGMLAYPSFPPSATHSLTVNLYKMLQLSLVECFHITTQQSDFNLIIWKLWGLHLCRWKHSMFVIEWCKTQGRLSINGWTTLT